jgi:hypothetical protein
VHVAAGVEVYGATNARFVGAYARHAIVDTGRMARKPALVDFVQAATLPVVAVTAWTMLFERGGVTRGSRVLVHGAAGNVGAVTLQMAHAAGAIVTALGRPEDASYLRSLGADVAGAYAGETFEAPADPVDLVIDTIGGEIQRQSFAALKPGGALISVVQPPDQEAAAKYGVRADFFIVDVSTRALEQVSAMLAAKTIVPNVGLVLPFSDARRAHELLADRPYLGVPALIQRSTTCTCSLGQAPSHGIFPASSDARIAAACATTSSYFQRSKAFIMLSRSFERNSGLTSFSYPGEPESGVTIRLSPLKCASRFSLLRSVTAVNRRARTSDETCLRTRNVRDETRNFVGRAETAEGHERPHHR